VISIQNSNDYFFSFLRSDSTREVIYYALANEFIKAEEARRKKSRGK
jgi:hypothetical protein